jgi:hypothetical protein
LLKNKDLTSFEILRGMQLRRPFFTDFHYKVLSEDGKCSIQQLISRLFQLVIFSYSEESISLKRYHVFEIKDKFIIFSSLLILGVRYYFHLFMPCRLHAISKDGARKKTSFLICHIIMINYNHTSYRLCCIFIDCIWMHI